MTLVVDASVALKWFLPDQPLAAEALSVVRRGSTLIAPDILIAEVCNAAWRSARLGRIGQDQVNEIAAILPRFFDALVDAALLAPRAVAIAAELDHPIYDCLYVALAEARQARLISADAQLLGSSGGHPGKQRPSIWRITEAQADYSAACCERQRASGSRPAGAAGLPWPSGGCPFRPPGGRESRSGR